MSGTKLETITNSSVLKSQPRPILKKSPALTIKKPVFFASDSTCSIDSDDSAESTAYSVNTINVTARAYIKRNETSLDSLDIDPLTTASALTINEPDRFQISSFGKKRSPLKSQNNKRRPLSSLYIFNSTEINKKIIKMLLMSTENFLDEFKRTVNNPDLTEKEFLKVYGHLFFPKLKEFITGEENNLDRFYDRMHTYEIGAVLSEPIISEMEKYRKENKVQKLKETHSVSRIDKEMLERSLGLDTDKQQRDEIICGSLPARSFFDSYNRELKNKEKVLLKTFRSKSIKTNNEDALLFSHAAANKSAKDKNKCIVSAATSTKKMVRFADAFGLDLEKVKIITNNSFVDAFSYSNQTDFEPSESKSSTEKLTLKANSKPFLVLIPLFALKKSFDSVLKLDDFIFDYENKLIKCVIKVKNLSYNKRIFARTTFNNWKKFTDLEAIYVKSESSKSSVALAETIHQCSYDYFAFCIIIPEKSANPITESSSKQTSIEDCTLRIEFALCYQESGNTHWDNNFNENYKFQCFYNMS